MNNNIKDFERQKRFLKKTMTDDDRRELKDRSLNDTRYLSRFLMNYIRDYLEFDNTEVEIKNRVNAVNGYVTAYVRKRWGIKKIRANGDLHHAADAAVIACITNGMINKATRWSKYQETRYATYADKYIVDRETGEVIEENQFPLPYPEFRKELDYRLMDNREYMQELLFTLPNYYGVDISKIDTSFVSRMPTRKATGTAHKDTIRSPKLLETDKKAISKTDLKDLKLKDGEIKDYYKPESDLLLYNALKKQLEQFGGDGKKAFQNEFHKPKSDGSEGPIVRKVKTTQPMKSYVGLNKEKGVSKGVAENDSMIRIDVFYIEGEGYYFVPIYIADTIEKKLPNRACVQRKGKEEWKEVQDSDFIFSLYPNDLIYVEKKRGQIKLSLNNKDSDMDKYLESNGFFLYFNSAHIGVAAFEAYNHDYSYCIGSLGIKTLQTLEKYQVDVLGNRYKVNKEVRQAFNTTRENEV